jgi:hypothetical protein
VQYVILRYFHMSIETRGGSRVLQKKPFGQSLKKHKFILNFVMYLRKRAQLHRSQWTVACRRAGRLNQNLSD